MVPQAVEELPALSKRDLGEPLMTAKTSHQIQYRKGIKKRREKFTDSLKNDLPDQTRNVHMFTH